MGLWLKNAGRGLWESPTSPESSTSRGIGKARSATEPVETGRTAKELEIGKPGLKWGVPGVESYKTFRILVEVVGGGDTFIIRPPDGWWQVAAFL